MGAKPNDRRLQQSDILCLSIRAMEINPDSCHGTVEIWHSIYKEKVVLVVIAFEETKVKPSVTFTTVTPYEIMPPLEIYLKREVTKVLRDAWRWGRKVRTANG